MSLPNFNAEGILPDGVHAATEAELKERCVEPFASSTSRQRVFDGFCRYRNDLAGLGLNVTQWVDGSFTDQTRLDPEDIDLVNYVNAAEINAFSSVQQPRVRALLNGRSNTKAAYHCHTFLETVFPSDHIFAPIFERQRVYWRNWWATPQDYSKPPVKTPAPHRGKKGIVVMTVGDCARTPTVNTNI